MKLAQPLSLLSLSAGALAHPTTCNSTKVPSTHLEEAKVQPFFNPNSTRPIHYGILLFPGFQALDVYGPLDVLNSLGLTQNFPIKLTVLAQTLDPVSTHAKTNMNHSMGHPLTRFDEKTVVERSLSDQLLLQQLSEREGSGNGTETPDTEALDILIVPGGIGTRNNVTAEIDFVKEMYPNLKALMSICTGATILARAGVLDGRNATTNKRAWPWATSTGPKVQWKGHARWVVDGNIITSSGVSAGIDATYAFVEINYGKKVADDLSNSAEYTRWRNASYDPFADMWNIAQS